MSADQGANVIWYVLVSTLVISALISRRFSMRGALAMALSWVVIFGVVLALFSYSKEFANIALHVKNEVTGQARQRVEGDSLHVKLAMDGHFWVDADINGTSAKFLIDSGATVTAVSDDVARRAGLNIDNAAPGMAMQTANGVMVAKRASIAGLTVGPIRTTDLPIVVSDRFSGVNVLGMNFLSRLRSWRVEGDEMVLEP